MALLASLAAWPSFNLFVAGNALAVIGVHAARYGRVASIAGSVKRLVQTGARGLDPGLGQALFRRDNVMAGFAPLGSALKEVAMARLASEMARVLGGLVGQGVWSGGMAIGAFLRLHVYGPAALALDLRFMVACGAIAHIIPVLLVAPQLGIALDAGVVTPDAGIVTAIGAVELLVLCNKVGLLSHAMA